MIFAVETAAAPDFEGSQAELEALLMKGVTSGEPFEADASFWNRLRTETDQMVTQRQARKPRS